MILNFHKGTGLISKAIMLGSEYSHVSIESGLFIYEAHIECGVRKVLRTEWDDSTVVHTIEFDRGPKHEARMVEWVSRQVGKKYDLLGVLSFVWIFLKEKKGKFFCSELAFIALMKLYGVFNDEYSARKTPQDVYEYCTIIKHL